MIISDLESYRNARTPSWMKAMLTFRGLGHVHSYLRPRANSIMGVSLGCLLVILPSLLSPAQGFQSPRLVRPLASLSHLHGPYSPTSCCLSWLCMSDIPVLRQLMTEDSWSLGFLGTTSSMLHGHCHPGPTASATLINGGDIF